MRNIDRIAFPGLMDEMLAISMKYKAEHIYYKCLLYGHKEWAESIRRKYNLRVQSDLAIAFGYTLAFHASKLKPQ